MIEKGKLIVISGPSGAGKSTVVFKAIEGRSDICFSTSVTTRKPRPNEVDGREYFFVEPDRFKEMVANDELLEHAEYVANNYGTPRAYVEQKLDAGIDVLLDIEVQGARQVNEKCLRLSKYLLFRHPWQSFAAASRIAEQTRHAPLRRDLCVRVRSMPRLISTIISLLMTMQTEPRLNLPQL